MYKTNFFSKLTIAAIFTIIIYRVAQIGCRIYDVIVLKHFMNETGNYANRLKFMTNEFKIEHATGNIVIIAWFISFSLWLFASYKQVQATSENFFSYKPAAALFSLIIPVFNLFAPYKIMNEIWTEQNRDALEEKSGLDLINTWWFFGIAVFIYSKYCNYKFEHARGAEELLKVEYHKIIYYAVSIHYFILLKKLMTLVDGEQNYSLQKWQ